MGYKENYINLIGLWRGGWALDYHTIEKDEYPFYKYSDIGMMLNSLKYKNDFSQVKILSKIVIEFLKTRWFLPISVMLPVPPSNIVRLKQPVYEI